MKRSFSILASLALAASLAACEFGVFDNYDEPNALLTGRVVYQGSPVGVRSNGVQLELWQPGYDLNQKIPIYVDQDGSFSAMVFDGEYKLNLLAGNGPWVDIRDTLQVQVQGQTQVDVPVVPYYTIENPSISHAAGVVTASFEVGSVDTSRELEYVGLYVSTTHFVDRSNMAVRTERDRADLTSLDDPVSLSVELTDDLQERADIYVRVGLKTEGVDELLFTPVQKITFCAPRGGCAVAPVRSGPAPGAGPPIPEPVQHDPPLPALASVGHARAVRLRAGGVDPGGPRAVSRPRRRGLPRGGPRPADGRDVPDVGVLRL